ncbi:BACON domain-containing protein [Marinobacter halodurans]|nr:fibronectin type III domain-containing protein [Marinobacter halodurans]
MTLASSPVAAYQLVVAESANRSGAVALAGQTVDGVIYVFIDQDSGLDQVRFRLDGVEVQVENHAPWDFSGTTSSDDSMPFDTTTIANGPHTIAASLLAGGQLVATLTATFDVANAGTGPQDGDDAPQFHTGWRGDPATSLTVSWLLRLPPADPVVEYRPAGSAAWQSAPAQVTDTTLEGSLLEATLTGLQSSQRYDLRVSLAPGVTSRLYSATTLPGSGAHDLEVLFVADTGLVGRDDGLTTGTEQVILEMANLAPSLVLLGGDYAYYNTDKRYGTLQATIGAWFEQMQPLFEYSPIMPTYGNHEILLGEGFGDWAMHFATPDGWSSRRMYSFDAGDVHFVSVFGVDEYASLPTDALQWLDADLADARARGQRWLIPFFHASPFSDGSNHGSALPLRGQLGPIFEAYGVEVVVTAHDQSFERTFPLVDVPTSNTPTTTARSCYDTDEGTTWLKVSPGGKLSNISRDFSPWRSATPPYWTVVRDNTLHHFAELSFTATGELVVNTLGVTGTGEPPVLVDQFRYSQSGCGAQYLADPVALDFEVATDGNDSRSVSLTSTGISLDFTVGPTPDWLSVLPASGSTPATLTFAVDGSRLDPGTQVAHVAIRQASGLALVIPVTVRPGAGAYSLRVSGAPDRSASQALDGASLQGNRYIFLSPEVNVKQARFYLDNPSASGTPRQTENVAPYDFAGTQSSDLAMPFDTTSIADGQHSVTVSVTTQSGDVLVTTADFVVANLVPQLSVKPSDVNITLRSPQTSDQATLDLVMTDGSQVDYIATSDAGWLSVSPASGTTPDTLTAMIDTDGLAPGNYQGQVHISATGQDDVVVTVNLAFDLASPYDLRVSLQPSRDGAVPLAGQTLTGEAYVFVPDVAGISRVRFYLDDPERLGSPIKTEGRAPWDFAGTVTGGSRPAYPFDFGTLSGSHQITAAVDTTDGLRVVTAGFTAGN